MRQHGYRCPGGYLIEGERGLCGRAGNRCVDACAFVYRERAVCTYPRCKCIVSTSTSQPEPKCPKGLE